MICFLATSMPFLLPHCFSHIGLCDAYSWNTFSWLGSSLDVTLFSLIRTLLALSWQVSEPSLRKALPDHPDKNTHLPSHSSPSLYLLCFVFGYILQLLTYVDALYLLFMFCFSLRMQVLPSQGYYLFTSHCCIPKDRKRIGHKVWAY